MSSSLSRLTIQSNIRNYDVIFEEGFSFIDELLAKNDPVFVIDQRVYDLYKKEFRAIPLEKIFLFEAVETNKTFRYTEVIYDFLLQKKVKRYSTFISIGGGITQDVTGFVASTFYRGLQWYFVPTTFLAMTDSCIGSKTSINYNQYKNLMGTFYPPSKIYINKDFLLTLSELDFFSGMGEVIKFQLMEENYPKNFQAISSKIEKTIVDENDRNIIIRENMTVKQSYMEGDEFDLGRRNLLNYGHCFGHALETASEYYVPHGIAVNIGMIFANLLSEQRNLLDAKAVHFINDKILMPHVKLVLRSKDFNEKVLLESMKNDKKRVGQFLTMILPDEEFRMIKVDDVTDIEFKQVFQTITTLLDVGQ